MTRHSLPTRKLSDHPDLDQIKRQARPEVSGSGLHIAVVERAPELVRVLMQHGANARVGVYPHRDATSPLAIATERGYHDIVAIIREEERHRQDWTPLLLAARTLNLSFGMLITWG